MNQKQNNCPSDSALMDIALDRQPNPAVSQHLAQCDQCKQTLAAFSNVHQQLQTRNRPSPDSTAIKQFHHQLDLALTAIQPQKRRAFFPIRPAFALTFAALFIFGLGLWTGRQHIPQSSGIESASSKTQLIQYLQQSEIWLLTVMNNQSDVGAGPENAELARRLLQQTYFMEQDSEFFDNPLLLPFLEQIEFMLLEAANADSTRIERVFSSIQTMIQQQQLLLRNQTIQTDILGPLST